MTVTLHRNIQNKPLFILIIYVVRMTFCKPYYTQYKQLLLTCSMLYIVRVHILKVAISNHISSCYMRSKSDNLQPYYTLHCRNKEKNLHHKNIIF